MICLPACNTICNSKIVQTILEFYKCYADIIAVSLLKQG